MAVSEQQLTADVKQLKYQGPALDGAASTRPEVSVVPDQYGQVAVITGAGSGLGRAMAMTFSGAGAAVAALDLDGESAAETAAAITREGGKARS